VVRYPGFNTNAAISATSAGRALAVTGA